MLHRYTVLCRFIKRQLGRLILVMRFMGPMAKSEIEDMEWVVKRRSKVQELLLQIYKRSISSGNGKKEAAILQLLVGVAYSLWRAVFLADTLRKPKDVSKNAKAFLRLLIKDNAIAYSQESNNRQWTVGYYLNNAYFRLQIAHAKLKQKTSLGNVVNEFIHKQASRNEPAHALQQQWETAYEASIEIFNVLTTKKRITRRSTGRAKAARR